MIFVKQQLYRVIFGIALVCAFALPASAQELKIGVVNIPALMERSPQTRSAMDALQEEFAPRQREFLAKQKEYEDLVTKVQKDVAVMRKTCAICSAK
jgi:outer membrane protein